ncbi:MAG TPA: TauD/TfdA family dioxygenase [Acetobacteraceae bacterium]|jgi:taurine dioxygenase|nr:TauD/TfdA family dioxygenase [Acetobacteraceae bacterium]
MSDAPFRVKPISGAIGAELHGIDLSTNLPDGTIAAIRQALLDHLVIFFRDQDLPPARFLALARRLGTPIEYPFVKGIDGFPDIINVAKLEHETVNFGGVWHSDTTYLQDPPMATLLIAREVPETGGDTLFANQYLAYETLSGKLRTLLADLKGVSSSAKADASRTREDRIRTDGSTDARRLLVAEHPAVRTHRETGRKALYVNRAHTVQFAGMSPEESAPLLEFLFTHQIRPDFTCRFRWTPGALAIWDNRCAQHYAINDYAGQRRIMQRITLAGDLPG